MSKKSNKYDQGMELYGKNKYQEALTFFNEAALSPDTIIQLKANYYSGQACYVLKKYPNSTTYFGNVISISSNLKITPEISNLVYSAYHYKGNALYALKKYNGAIKCFEEVPDSQDIAMCANLYKGFCYEQRKLINYSEAERCFKKVLELYESSSYYDKNNIKSMAQRALTVNLIHQEKFQEVLEIYKNEIDKLDDTGNTLLMYATAHEAKPLIQQLIELGANPFKADKLGNSAFSIAISNRNENIAKIFLKKIISDESVFEEEEHSLPFYIDELCTKKSAVILGVSKAEVEAFCDVAKEYYTSIDLDNVEYLGHVESFYVD